MRADLKGNKEKAAKIQKEMESVKIIPRMEYIPISQGSVGRILCCQRGVPIEQNPTKTCDFFERASGHHPRNLSTVRCLSYFNAKKRRLI